MKPRLRSIAELQAKMNSGDPLSMPGLLDGNFSDSGVPEDVLRQFLGSPDSPGGSNIAQRMTDNKTAQGLLGHALDYGPAIMPAAVGMMKKLPPGVEHVASGYDTDMSSRWNERNASEIYDATNAFEKIGQNKPAEPMNAEVHGTGVEDLSFLSQKAGDRRALNTQIENLKERYNGPNPNMDFEDFSNWKRHIEGKDYADSEMAELYRTERQAAAEAGEVTPKYSEKHYPERAEGGWDEYPMVGKTGGEFDTRSGVSAAYKKGQSERSTARGLLEDQMNDIQGKYTKENWNRNGLVQKIDPVDQSRWNDLSNQHSEIPGGQSRGYYRPIENAEIKPFDQSRVSPAVEQEKPGRIIGNQAQTLEETRNNIRSANEAIEIDASDMEERHDPGPIKPKSVLKGDPTLSIVRKPDSMNAIAVAPGGDLSPDEQKELAALQAKHEPQQPQGDLSPAEQKELATLSEKHEGGDRPWYDVSLDGTAESFRNALPFPTHMPQGDPNRPWYDVSAKGTGQAMLNAVPAMASTAGYAVGGPAGGGLGGMAGESARSAVESYKSDQSPSREDFYKGLAGAGIQGAQGGMQADIMTHRLGGAMGVKENAPAIVRATERMGGKPTAGQVSASPIVQGYESSLEQSPTIGGALVRNETAPIRQSFQNTAEGLLKDRAGELDPHAAGLQARSQMIQDAESRYAEPKRLYQGLEKYTKDINATENSTRAVARNIEKIPGVGIEGSPAKNIANWVNKTLLGDGSEETQLSADQIKRLKTRVGKKGEALRAQNAFDDAGDVSEIYDKLRRLQENSIKRGILYSARTKGEGDTIAKGMLGQLKSANTGFKDAQNSIKDVVGRTGVASDVSSLGHFKDIMNNTNTTDLQKNLLSLGNTEGNEALYKFSPKTAEILRTMRLEDIAKKSSDMNKNMSASGLMKATKNLSPRDEQMLFGKGKMALSDMREVNASFPKKTGASDTPRGMEYSEGQTFHPMDQLMGLIKYGGYKALGSGAVNAAKSMAESPGVNDMLKEGLLDSAAKKPVLKAGLINLLRHDSRQRSGK